MSVKREKLNFERGDFFVLCLFCRNTSIVVQAMLVCFPLRNIQHGVWKPNACNNPRATRADNQKGVIPIPGRAYISVSDVRWQPAIVRQLVGWRWFQRCQGIATLGISPISLRLRNMCDFYDVEKTIGNSNHIRLLPCMHVNLTLKRR